MIKAFEKPIYSMCKTENCSCEDKCSIGLRVKKRLPLIYWINRIFLILMMVIIVAWVIDAYKLTYYIRSIIW